MTRDELTLLTHQHAKGVAKALGLTYVEPAGPTGDNDDYLRYWAELTGPNGEHLHVGIHDGRFSWGVRYPNGPDGREMSLPYKETRPSITVAMNRPVEVVAREITRRLLPTYLPQLQAANLRVAEATAYENQTKGNVRYLARVLEIPDPGEDTRRPDRASILRLPSWYTGSLYGDITVTGTSVRIDLHGVPVALAATILAAIRDAQPKKEENV